MYNFSLWTPNSKLDKIVYFRPHKRQSRTYLRISLLLHSGFKSWQPILTTQKFKTTLKKKVYQLILCNFFIADATICSKKIAHEYMKKLSSKVAHNSPNYFQYCPELPFGHKLKIHIGNWAESPSVPSTLWPNHCDSLAGRCPPSCRSKSISSSSGISITDHGPPESCTGHKGWYQIRRGLGKVYNSKKIQQGFEIIMGFWGQKCSACIQNFACTDRNFVTNYLQVVMYQVLIGKKQDEKCGKNGLEGNCYALTKYCQF